MTAPRTFEGDLLAPAKRLIESFAQRYGGNTSEARLQLLEATASRLGGFWLEAFHAQFGIQPIASASDLLEVAKEVVVELRRTAIHPALALSALSREELAESSQKTTGAYHTDFRLAARLAQLASARLKTGAKVIDPACGAGILLVALSIESCGPDRRKMARWLAESVYAADLSKNSLRSALLALASLTSDLGALAMMRAKWVHGDSLMLPTEKWFTLAPGGFDVVVGNPPWEKLKVTRHEFLRARGHERHYGSAVSSIDDSAFEREKSDVSDYARDLVKRYVGLQNGEPDLYIAFAELFEQICRPGGIMAALFPAGLIRSQGTEEIRTRLFGRSSRVSVSIIENRARFFTIDTRFKFLATACTKALSDVPRRGSLTLLHEKGNATGVEQFGSVRLGREALADVRPDFSIPEVRNANEWRIYRRVAENGTNWSNPAWNWAPHFCREVDMTRDRAYFHAGTNANSLALVEGRMVQQHRFGAKEYKTGTGRKAVWQTLPFGSSHVRPQFRINAEDLPKGVQIRVRFLRAGFCDITGQTNERSMMAALIPPGVACGNKVPTVFFPNDPSEDRLLVWVAVMNSFIFDWMLRRVVTTTVNYFLLLSVPMPKLVKDGLPWRRLASASRELRDLDKSGSSDRVICRVAQLRAEIDAEIAVSYGISVDDCSTIMEDFPLLDRGQPPLEGEPRSTITKDTVLSCVATRMQRKAGPWCSRAREGHKLGARPYIASEFANNNPTEEKGIANDL